MKSIAYYIAITIFTILFFVPFSLLFVLTVAFDRERALLHHASRLWSKTIFRINPWWRVRVEGLEHIQKGVPYVVITNHQAMLDIPIMYWLPFNFKWVSKREVAKMPIFGWVLRMHGDILIERGATGSAKKMIKDGCGRLRRGTSVIIFPEGTRSRDGHVGRFKEGAFLLAKSASVAILPCIIDGTGSLNKGWRLAMPHRFSVKILPPISSEVVAQSDIKELTAKARELYPDLKKRF